MTDQEAIAVLRGIRSRGYQYTSLEQEVIDLAISRLTHPTTAGGDADEGYPGIAHDFEQSKAANARLDWENGELANANMEFSRRIDAAVLALTGGAPKLCTCVPAQPAALSTRQSERKDEHG